MITTITITVGLRQPTKIVSLMPPHIQRIDGSTGLATQITDGSTVTATRIDQAGSASGTSLTDDRGNVFATFGSALAAGTWSLSV